MDITDERTSTMARFEMKEMVGIHIDKDLRKKIYDLEPRTLPKPDFVLCPRFKGKEYFKGHYRLKAFHYGKIQTKDMAEIDQTYREKVREAEQKGPVYVVAHDAGNDAEAAKTNNLLSPLKIYE